MPEQAPRIEQKQRIAREVRRKLRKQIEKENEGLTDLVNQFRAAIDILHHAESTGSFPERVAELRAHAKALKEEALALAAKLDPIESAEDKLAETFDAGAA